MGYSSDLESHETMLAAHWPCLAPISHGVTDA
jgi:hypothetical protein